MIHKNREPLLRGSLIGSRLRELVGGLGLGETIAAVNRSAVARLERDLCFLAAGGAYGGEHLADAAGIGRARTAATLLPGLAAGWAALGLVGETLGGEELLFRGGENEISSAIRALDGFVLGHG